MSDQEVTFVDDPQQVSYDPTLDPRSLAPAPQPTVAQVTEQMEARVEQLGRILAIYDRQIGMFNSAGWKSTVAMLQDDLQTAVNFLADRRVEHADTMFVRGQVAAIQGLMSMAATVEHNRTQAREELHRIREALSGASE